MADIGERFRIWLQWAVIRAQPYPVLGTLLRLACRLGTWQVGRRLSKLRGVRAVYIRHTHPGAPAFLPGHSDLDLTVILSDEEAGDPKIFEDLAEEVEHRRLFTYYLDPADARYLSEGELVSLEHSLAAAPVEPLQSVQTWRLLSGREVRSHETQSFPAGMLPLHPEFNRWWQHILQEYVLAPPPGQEKDYLRVFYRGAIKQMLIFHAASTGTMPGQTLTLDLDAAIPPGTDPELDGVLRQLKGSNFWCRDGGKLKSLIFLHVLKSAATFFSGFQNQSKVSKTAPCFPSDRRRHGDAYTALSSKLDRHPGLSSALEGALAYPIPYCHPYHYQVDLIVPEDVSGKSFGGILKEIENAFHRRECREGDYSYFLTIIPASAYRHSLVFLGSPYPFLREHMQRYAQSIIGELPAGLEGSTEESTHVELCRTFFPWFLFNASRRVEHSSRTLNLCQLASVRLFLECGEIVTDAVDLQLRHQERFRESSPDHTTWRYLIRDKPGRGDHAAYLKASEALASELRHVAGLLDLKGAVKSRE